MPKYRPPGWGKAKSEDCAKCADYPKSNACAFCNQNYEAGADALLDKLAEAGIVIEDSNGISSIRLRARFHTGR